MEITARIDLSTQNLSFTLVLTIAKIGSSHGSRYYTADTPGGELAESSWQGNISQALDLLGRVEQPDLERLLEGWTPGESRESMLMVRQPNRVAAIDATFSAPKSVSIEALVNGNAALAQAHRAAVTEALNMIERDAQARIRDRRKRSTFVETNQLAIAKFEHLLSRTNDPQLHTHGLIINVTRTEGQWRSWYSRRLFQKIKEYGGFYRKQLANGVRKLGYAIRETGQGFWELTCVPTSHIALFSKRSHQITNLTNEHLSVKQKAIGKLIDRPLKQERPLSELLQDWQQAVSVLERNSLVR